MLTIASVNDHIELQAGSSLLSTSGTVTVSADTAGGNAGGITMLDGSAIDSGSGLVDLNADGDILLTSVSTTSEVQATSVAGGIFDNDVAIDDADITAATVALRAETGIGDDANSLETVSDATAGSLTLAALTDSGDIHAVNAGTLIVGTVDGLSGVTISDAAVDDNSGGDNVTLLADSPLTVNDNISNADGGSVTVTAIDSASPG